MYTYYTDNIGPKKPELNKIISVVAAKELAEAINELCSKISDTGIEKMIRDRLTPDDLDMSMY